MIRLKSLFTEQAQFGGMQTPFKKKPAAGTTTITG